MKSLAKKRVQAFNNGVGSVNLREVENNMKPVSPEFLDAAKANTAISVANQKYTGAETPRAMPNGGTAPAPAATAPAPAKEPSMLDKTLDFFGVKPKQRVPNQLLNKGGMVKKMGMRNC